MVALRHKCPFKKEKLFSALKLSDDFVWSVKRTLRACLQGERVTLAGGLKLALVYKQISLVGLYYHPAQRNQLYIVQMFII